MSYRIITHGGCMDGYCSAFVIKRYFLPLLNIADKDIEIIQLQPRDVQGKDFKFTKNDIVVDLPQPRVPVLFWCDHHITSQPTTPLPDTYHWKRAPSCAGVLLDIAWEQGVTKTKALEEFRDASDIMDDAAYTKEMIKECFYPFKATTPSILQQMHLISAMFHTRDPNLNQEVFRTLLNLNLEETPLECKELWTLRPEMYYTSLMEGYKQWRELVSTYVTYNEDVRCVVQDDRKITSTKGVYDRFYVYLKFPKAKYGINVRVADEKEAKMGIGCNIFHKEWCMVNIGELCAEVGKKFGEGSGGGHPTVGGTTISPKNVDKAIEFVLERLNEEI